jgi:hypothetical protein
MEHSKMEKQDHLIDLILEFVVKWWAWGAYIFIGMVGRVGLMLRRKVKTSIIEDISSLLIAGFIGYLATIWCMYKYPAPDGKYSIQGAIIIPMATLLSDRLMAFLLNINWIPLFEILTGKKDEKKK